MSALTVVGVALETRGLRVGVLGLALTMAIAASVFLLLTGRPGTLVLLAGLAGVSFVQTANLLGGDRGNSGLRGGLVAACFAVDRHVTIDPAPTLVAIATGAVFPQFLPWQAPTLPTARLLGPSPDTHQVFKPSCWVRSYIA